MKISLRGRHALMVEDGAISHKIDIVTFFLGRIPNQNLSHQNCITDSRVMAILLNGWILSIG